MRKCMVVLALVVLAGAVAGCDPAQQRQWTTRASIVELQIINNSEFMDDALRIEASRLEALGTARVLCYEKWGVQLKTTLDELKDQD